MTQAIPRHIWNINNNNSYFRTAHSRFVIQQKIYEIPKAHRNSYLKKKKTTMNKDKNIGKHNQ